MIIVLNIAIFIVGIIWGIIIAKILYPRMSIYDVVTVRLDNIKLKGLLILAFSIIISCFGLFYSIDYFREIKHNKNLNLAAEELVLSKEKFKKEINLKPLLAEQHNKLKVMDVLQKYLHSEHLRDTPSLDTFFVFPMKKYYRIEGNVSKEKVNERQRYYWSRHEKTRWQNHTRRSKK
jgi:hypothetical protein